MSVEFGNEKNHEKSVVALQAGKSVFYTTRKPSFQPPPYSLLPPSPLDPKHNWGVACPFNYQFHMDLTLESNFFLIENSQNQGGLKVLYYFFGVKLAQKDLYFVR